ESGIGGRAGVGGCGAQVCLYAHRRLRLDAYAQGRARARDGSRDGVQLERLRRVALGRTRQERRGRHMQAACALGAARQDDGLSRLVPRAAAAATRLARRTVGPVQGPTSYLVIVKPARLMTSAFSFESASNNLRKASLGK